ncbi:hypothetical protein FXO37_09814 [Capsicum annuum]|nr:hypothetical protein FXO37_09814 [Capsicum annuum]
MPRFKRMQKKQKLDLPISTSQGTESACLPTNLPPPIQHAPQPSRPVYSASHPTPMDQDTPHPGSTVWPESQPSRSVHSTSHQGLANQDSSQSSRSIHSTSHSDPTNEDSSQASPIGEERIMVKFDIYDEPFGEARNLLLGFCGILACDCSLFAINFEKWSNLPVTFFNRVFDLIIKMAETGQWPGRTKMYIATHMNQDGVYVNEAAKEICFRGGRGRARRNFSHRPTGEGSEQDIVTGDSHFNSVREPNRNLRPPNFRPFRPRASTPNIHPNQHIYGQLPPPQPRLPFNHNQQSYRAMPPPPGLYQNQQFNRGEPPQYYQNQQLNRPIFYENQQFNRPNFFDNRQFNRPNFYENQQFRPRPSPPKALNFRNWEYARPGPPLHCGIKWVMPRDVLAFLRGWTTGGRSSFDLKLWNGIPTAIW